MEQTPSRLQVRILAVCLIVSIALLVYALWRMDSLSERLDGFDQRLGLTSRDVQQTTSDIQARADDLESRVASLEQSAGY
jgi:sensor c-di-GMP phosphodiesterase-like protein